MIHLTTFGNATATTEAVVPKNYSHANQLTSLNEQTRVDSSYSKILNDINFSKTTNKLLPGKTYRLEIIPIVDRTTSDLCIRFQKERNAIFAGAQGLAFAQKHYPEIFPINKWVISFDKKEALWENTAGEHMLPLVRRMGVNNWKVELASFNVTWLASDFFLLCFFEIDKSNVIAA